MANLNRVLKWSLSIVGGGLGFWYLKDPTRRQDLLDFPPFPNDRLRDMLGCEVNDRNKELFGKKWRFSMVVNFCERVFPRSYVERDIDPDLPFVNPLEALAQLELLDDQFEGAPPQDEEFDDFPLQDEEFEEPPPLDEPELEDEVEDFEPNAPPENELEDEPQGVGGGYLPRRVGPHELVAGPEGWNIPAPVAPGAVGGFARASGEDLENAAVRSVAEAVVRDVLEAAQERLAANRVSGSNENLTAGDEASSSVDDQQRPVAHPSRRVTVGLSLRSTPKKQRVAMAEESEDETSTSSG